MSKASDSESKHVSKSEADVLWEQVKKVPISMFGMAAQPLEKMAKRIDVVPDKVHLNLNAPGAAVAFIEDALNVRRDGHGSEMRVNGYSVEVTNNGMLVISRNIEK